MERSQGNVHVVVASEGPVAVGAFARSRGESLLDAVLAEDVTAGFDDRVLEVATANGAQGKRLTNGQSGGQRKRDNMQTYPQHLILRGVVAQTLVLPIIQALLRI